MSTRGRVLISGGCGFVGRRFATRLLREGRRVVIVDNLSSGVDPRAWSHHLTSGCDMSRLQFCEGDVRSYFEAAVPDDFDVVVHLAAVVGGRMTIESQPLMIATDLAIDADLFNWVVSGDQTPRTIYFSSSAAYPIVDQAAGESTPLRESLVTLGSGRIGEPDLTYGWAKLTGELLARHAMERYDALVSVYRPFSGYGEDQDTSYPFPAIVQRAVEREDPLVIWGSGEQTRDFIHIDDIVEAVMSTYEALDARTPLNLGTGIATTPRDLALMAASAVGYQPEIVPDESKPKGVMHRVCDPAELNKHFVPSISLREGVARAVAYCASRTPST